MPYFSPHHIHVYGAMFTLPSRTPYMTVHYTCYTLEQWTEHVSHNAVTWLQEGRCIDLFADNSPAHSLLRSRTLDPITPPSFPAGGDHLRLALLHKFGWWRLRIRLNGHVPWNDNYSASKVTNSDYSCTLYIILHMRFRLINLQICLTYRLL